jgi:hypothetical protein
MPATLAVPALALLLAGGGLAAWGQAAWPHPAGLAVAAGAPLLFILQHGARRQTLHHHPVTVSCLSGLGCVIVMIGQQRFGPEPGWTLPAALGALAIWVLWQRRQRRPEHRKH